MRLLLAALLLGPSPSQAAALTASLAAAEARAPVPAPAFTLPAPSGLLFPAASLPALTPPVVPLAPALAAPALAAPAVPAALFPVISAAAKPAGTLDPAPARPAAAALAELVADPVLAGALFDGMAGVASTPAEREEFARLAAGLYAAAPGSDEAVSATGLRRRLSRPTKDPEKDQSRRRLLRALLDLPRLTAEGMVRVNLRTPSAETLRRGLIAAKWKTRDGEPVADAVIVGGGPAGLSTALQAADKGAKVVLFEGGWLAQSFSDAAMKPVYRMRTNSTRNSLAQEPFSDPALVKRAGLVSSLKHLRRDGKDADARRFARDGRPPIGHAVLDLEDEDPAVASARVELLQHFALAADEVERLGSRIVENAPVNTARKRADGLWEIRTAAGHLVLARKLVLAQGQVGGEVQHTKDPAPAASALPEKARLVLNGRADLEAQASRLAAAVQALRRGRAPPRLPVVHDSLLGSPEVREYLALLPRGRTVAVIGSGESAAKAVMDLLRLNGGLIVHLFVKDALASAQLQIPAPHAAPEAIKRAQDDPDAARRSLEEWKAFGTPITPATYADLQDEAARGRVVVHALGARFDARAGGSVKAAWDGAALTLRSAAGAAAITGALIWASGYDRRALRADPLTASLEKAGLLRRAGGRGLDADEFALGEDRLSSAADPDLYLAGAQSFALSADSAIPGAVARAARLAEAIARPSVETSRPRDWVLPAVLTALAVASSVFAFPLLAQAAFWTANLLAFAYIAPQIHRLLRNRSADISTGTAAIGLVSASVMTMDFAHLGQELMTYRNLAQAGGFAIVLGLKAWYDRHAAIPGPAAKAAAVGRTALALAGLGLILLLGGPLALAAAPSAAWLDSLLVPFQILSGFGFTWLMMPQFEKIAREGAIGDASEAMAWGFVGTRTIWIWSLSTLAALSLGGTALALAPLAAFSALALAASGLTLGLLRRSNLTRWRGFLALAAVMAAEVLAGWLILPHFAAVPAGAESKYLMYLCYLVQNLTAFLAAVMTALAFRRR
ncbi:MAG: FAD-binding protein [Elusimicrobia bacterium]|nr:FAD-binding protein [Elusimicrobiota bacterium]